MDAGLNAIDKRGPSKARLRSQLLNGDIGNIDVTNERPINQQQQTPMPLHHPYQPQQVYAPPFQEQQQPGPYMHPMNGRSQNSVQQGYYPSPKHPRHQVPGQSSRKSSMTSASFSNFFKGKHSSSRTKENEEDEEVIMSDQSSSMVTFNDLSTLRNNGGHKYGFGGAMDDTSPIIPTIITKNSGNMNNIEYRKHMTIQKKMALNAAAKQQGPTPPGGPRAMSLQSTGNPYRAYTQIHGPGPGPSPGLGPIPGQNPSFPNGGQMPHYGPRANSLMSGPPQRFRQPPQGGYPPRPMGFGQEGPRAMSLTNSGRPPNMAMPPQQPYPSANYGPVPPQYANGPRTMSLQNQRPPNFTNTNTSRDGLPRQVQPQSSQPQSHPPRQPNATAASSSSYLSSTSSSSDPMGQIRDGTPDTESVDEPSKEDMSSTSMEQSRSTHVQSPLKNEISSKSKLNVLKLSAPQQQELELREKESTGEDYYNLNQKQQYSTAPNLGKDEENFRNPQNESHDQEIDLRPSSELENGMENLSVEDPSVTETPSKIGDSADTAMHGNRDSKTQSVATFYSSFSNDSPLKKRNKPSGIYRLENGTEGNVYVTASEFPTYIEDTDVSNESQSTIIQSELGEKPSAADTKNNRRSLGEASSKSNGFVKAKNFLRKISLKQEKSQPQVQTHRRISSTPSITDSESSNEASSRNSKSSFRVDWNNSSSGNNAKRKSFHSLFSNSSLGYSNPNANDQSSPLKDIQEGVTVTSAGVFQGSQPIPSFNLPTSSSKDLLNEKPPEPADRSISNASTHLASENNNPLLQVESTALEPGNKNEQNVTNGGEDDFVFDNSIARPYQPIFATKDELTPAPSIARLHGSDTSAPKFKTVQISGDQLNILTENKNLMHELEMVSKELAESIARETNLEQQLLSNAGTSKQSESLSLADFEVELRKKSAKIVQLIQELNEERLKRYIAEEQVLLHESGAKPSSIDLVYKIDQLNKQLISKDDEIAQLKLQPGTWDMQNLDM